jgi:diguanylate cyclase (GGDEF)-like protein/PAS domain S-box-containing protein
MLDDDNRLRLLNEFELGHGDELLDTIAAVAARACGTPMAAISLLGRDDQMFVGSIGLDIDRTDRQSSFCAEAMLTPGTALLVPDTHQDPRFVANALVVGAPHIRAYAGVPLLAAERVPLGAVCVLSDRPQELSGAQVETLRALGLVTERLLHARRTAQHLRESLAEVAALRAAEQASREESRTAFDHATTGMNLADQQGRYVRVNRAFAAMLGHHPDDLVGLSFREITAEDDVDTDIASINELVTGHLPATLREKRYRHRDGRLIPALVSTSLIRPDVNGTWQLLSVVESLAERRAAEERLLELHSAVDGIISIDENSRVVAWNLGAERLLGHRAGDMIGHNLDRIMPAGMRAAHHAGVTRVAAGGPERLIGSAVEVPVVHADGHELLAELSLSRWSHDGRTRFTAILRDVTEQRRAETCTALVRHAAVTANSADTFAAAAASIVRDVCTRLNWLAGHAWTTTAGEPAAWHVAEHAHQHGAACPLTALAAAGAAPEVRDLASGPVTRIADCPEGMTGMAAAMVACAVGTAVAVPVLAGGEVVGTLAFYLATGCTPPGPQVVAALEDAGLALGRVVERERTAGTLTWQANHDPVTDLPNRRLLLENIRGTQEALAGGATRRSAILLINLDRFRLINDSLGYAVGDQALHQAADRLRHLVRGGDLVARLGADEFVVLAHHDDTTADRHEPDPFAALATRLLEALHAPLHLVGHRVQLRASIGICPLTVEHGAISHHPAGVLRDADSALRQAKRRGKDQIQVFDAALRSTADQRMDDETALAQAITAGELTLHYQPIVALETGRAVGAEALVRWSRPGHGMVPPDRFIPLAEDSGLIVDLGRWVLRRACRDAATWHHSVPPMASASISVNVSTRQLIHPRFLRDLDEALADSGLDAHRLIVEITETALIEDVDTVMQTLTAIRDRGAQIALDDFGTGYSSLSYVKSLPATILKIDKSFVDPITGPGDGTALTEVVLKLAEATGLRTVAEGVETPEQAEALRQLGCQRGQGYTWSRPVPLEQLLDAVDRMAAADMLT